MSSDLTLISKTPILPLSIISTSFPGIALMDYSKKGDEELDLAKDDALRVFKRYNHWSYVSSVILSFHFGYKLDSFSSTGCQRSRWRSWMGTGMLYSFPLALPLIPVIIIYQSWFIGKVSTTGVVSPPGSTSSTNLPVEDGSTQVSPLSSAFPPQLRTPTS